MRRVQFAGYLEPMEYGVANTELTCELAYQLERLYYVLSEEANNPDCYRKDTRLSGDMLKTLVVGIYSGGALAAWSNIHSGHSL